MQLIPLFLSSSHSARISKQYPHKSNFSFFHLQIYDFVRIVLVSSFCLVPSSLSFLSLHLLPIVSKRKNNMQEVIIHRPLHCCHPWLWKALWGFFDEGIYRQYIRTGCTRSEDNILKVFNTSLYLYHSVFNQDAGQIGISKNVSCYTLC